MSIFRIIIGRTKYKANNIYMIQDRACDVYQSNTTPCCLGPIIQLVAISVYNHPQKMSQPKESALLSKYLSFPRPENIHLD